MADYIKVSTQNIGADEEAIQKELEGIGQAVQSLYEDMQSLGQTWEGMAWQGFQAQVSLDFENMQLLCEKLSSYLTHMENARKEYQKCTSQVDSLVDSIQI